MESIRLRKSVGMKLTINGDERDFAGPLTLAGLVDKLGMKQDRVAIELNRDIVSRDQWLQISLSEGDRLEIVHFVGGGLR
jgi:thiamine biosynthesis protein ThiS